MAFLRPHSWRRFGLHVLLVLLLAFGAARMVVQVRPLFERKGSSFLYYDFKLMVQLLRGYERTGVLYDTNRPDAFSPKSISSFKYPPPYAALILSLIPPLDTQDTPNAGLTTPLVRPVLVFYLAVLAGALILCLVCLHPRWEIGALMAGVFLNWQAIRESLVGPQIEPLLLLLLAGTLCLILRRRQVLAGAAIGVAGAFKAYPWGLALVFLPRRWGRGAFGVVGGTVVALLVSALVIPYKYTWQWLLHVFPRMGGLAVDSENVSIPGNLMRLAFAIAGRKPPDTLYLMSGHWLKESALAVPVLAASLATALVLILILQITREAWVRTRNLDDTRVHALWLSLWVCLMIALMPTCWVNYHLLLVLPLMVCLALAPLPAADPLTWSLMLYMAIAGAVYCGPCTLATTLPRSFVPLAGWLACLRLLRRPVEEAAIHPAVLGRDLASSAPAPAAMMLAGGQQ